MTSKNNDSLIEEKKEEIKNENDNDQTADFEQVKN